MVGAAGPGRSGVEPVDIDPPICGRIGGVPCRERWNAFIFASILSGKPPLGAVPCLFMGTFGLRALLNMPRGVEEAVMGLVIGGSDTDRKEGTRGVLCISTDGLVAGNSSSELGEASLSAKSMESSGALGALLGGVAMVRSVCYLESMW